MSNPQNAGNAGVSSSVRVLWEDLISLSAGTMVVVLQLLCTGRWDDHREVTCWLSRVVETELNAKGWGFAVLAEC